MPPPSPAPEPEAPPPRGTRRYVIALLLLLVFAGVPVVVFTPLGTALRNVIGGRSGGGEESAKRVVATLAMVTREVKHRDRAALDWQDAREAMSLSDGDKIRTFADSTAKVSFVDGGGELELEPQTLITIRAPKLQDRLLMADVEIDGGNVRTTMSRGADGTEKTLRIRSGGKTVAEITTAGSETGVADFSVVLRSDRSTGIVMHRGTAKVTSMGKTITLSEGNAVTAAEGSSELSAPEPVKAVAAPQLTLPDGALVTAVIGTSGVSSPVSLAWAPVEGGVKYQVEVSPDSTFARPDDSADVESPQWAFVPGAPGQYYWRVRAIDENQMPGELSAPRSFTVIGAPPPTPVPTPTPRRTPKKPVLPPPAFVGTVGEPLLVKGKLAKSARKVSVNGKPARLNKATATYEVLLENLGEGKRIIVVETIFEDGSVKHEKKDAFIKQASAPSP